MSHDRPPWIAELHDSYVRLSSGAHHLDFHLAWLRDGAGDGDVVELAVDDEVLRIRWTGDARASRFPIAWLLQHAYAMDRVAAPRPPSDVSYLEVSGDGDPVTVIARALPVIKERGAAVIRREARDPAAETAVWTIALAINGFEAASAVTLLDPAAVDVALGLDVSDDAPRFHVLHAIADGGGDLLLADTRAALRYLSSHDADAARRLLETPIRSDARPHLPFDKVEGWYRARDRFARVIRDPRHLFRIRARAGDVVIFDRQRMLLGRHAGKEPAVRAITFAPAEPATAITWGCAADDHFDRSG